MDRDKPEERRHDRRISLKRVRLAKSLTANYLRLGAGVSLSMISYVVLSGFVVAAEGQSDGAVAPRHPASEIRLKSIGATVTFAPIDKFSSVLSPAIASQPHSSKIQLDPMTGDSLETLDQPIFAGAHTENIQGIAVGSHISIMNDIGITGKDNASLSTEVGRSAVNADASGHADTNHPHILSLRRLDLQPPAEKLARAAEERESLIADRQPEIAAVANPAGKMPPSILVQSLDEEMEPEANPAITFSLSDSVSGATTHTDDIASLPLLPLPTNRQWLAAAPAESEAEKQRDHRSVRRMPTADIPAPQTISVAKVKRMSTTHVEPRDRREGAAVPARLSSFLRPEQAVQQPPTQVMTPAEAVAMLMTEIRGRYPSAQVFLADVDGRLVVRGNCLNRKEATGIIRLIRSHLLIPVDDQMVIR